MVSQPRTLLWALRGTESEVKSQRYCLRRCSTIMFYSSKQLTFWRLELPLDDGATSPIDLE
jgi:hypothetical protein